MKFKLLLVVILSIMITVNEKAMCGETQKRTWKKPAFVSWDEEGILLGGITLKEMQNFYVWSLDKEKMLWYVTLKGPRYKSYSKESRDKKILLKYDTVLPGYEQLFPKNSKMQTPEIGEAVKIYFCYTMDWYFGPRFETVETYLRKAEKGYDKIKINSELDTQNQRKINKYVKKLKEN